MKNFFYQKEVDRSRMFYYQKGFIIRCEIISKNMLIVHSKACMCD